jgi:hypothetical protein
VFAKKMGHATIKIGYKPIKKVHIMGLTLMEMEITVGRVWDCGFVAAID